MVIDALLEIVEDGEPVSCGELDFRLLNRIERARSNCMDGHGGPFNGCRPHYRTIGLYNARAPEHHLRSKMCSNITPQQAFTEIAGLSMRQAAISTICANRIQFEPLAQASTNQ
jgi:hypothetical protein